MTKSKTAPTSETVSPHSDCTSNELDEDSITCPHKGCEYIADNKMVILGHIRAVHVTVLREVPTNLKENK